MLQSAAAPVTLNPENPISVMQRVEMKYILNARQAAALLRGLEGHMVADAFGLTSIASLYYDTPDRRLIRASLEKPPFKEKLRLRSYGPASETSPVFLELKRKANGTVYKRRVRSTIPAVEQFFAGEAEAPDGQIDRELAAFRDYYDNLAPACLIIYDRTAYYEPDGELRLTIDANPRYRIERLDLTSGPDGIPLLPQGSAILEIKVQSAVPLWLTRILSRDKIYQSGFSKYGEAYKREILNVS